MSDCLNKSILRSISVDLAEMIIVLTDDYLMYKTITNDWSSKMYNTTSSLFGLTGMKLRETSRVKRIRDKLTKRIITLPSSWLNGFIYEYNINDVFFREYDKPAYIIASNKGVVLDRTCFTWVNKSVFENGVVSERSNGCPSFVSILCRTWMFKSSLYRENDEPSQIEYVLGLQRWNTYVNEDSMCTDAIINEKDCIEYDIKRSKLRYCEQRIGENGENLPLSVDVNGIRLFKDNTDKLYDVYIMNYI